MKRTPELVYYRDRKKEWRWKVVAANGRIIANSGEGYTRYAFCVKGWEQAKLAETHSEDTAEDLARDNA